MLQRVRAHFESESVLEVDTPTLSLSAVSDRQIESIEAISRQSTTPLYLHTSPEFCMKRLLASGYPDIYSICRVYRDGELGRNHQPEFTMIEWYRIGFNLSDIVADTLKAIANLMDDATLAVNAQVIDYRRAFQETCGIDPLHAPIVELADLCAADDDLRLAMGNERDDWLDLIVTRLIAPSFATDRLTVLQHYPASQAALAELCPNDPSVADRFEVFMGELELANGYVELTNADVQAKRIANDQAARKKHRQPIRPIDQHLLAALHSGLPQCAGVAMGLERLHMKYDHADSIHKVVTFPFETDQ